MRLVVFGALPVLLGSEVCYQYGGYDTCDLGCYTNEYPFGNTPVRPLSRLPLSPDDLDTEYLLDTKEYLGHRLDPRDQSTITNSHFRKNEDLMIAIHGWVDTSDPKASEDLGWIRNITTKMLAKNPEMNIIRVNWVKGSRNIDYAQSATDTQVVAAVLNCLMTKIYGTPIVSEYLDRIHCVGHSLGAQTCGYFGHYMRRDNGEPIARATGLDPAEPYFGYSPNEVQLDSTDAKFVDIIHSDATHFLGGSLREINQGMGIMENVGHIDFWPNNGTDQPGCDQSIISTIFGLDGFMDGVRDFVACNHMRSYKFFLESLNFENDVQTCKFTGYQCGYDELRMGACMSCSNGDCPSMGYDAINWKGVYPDKTAMRLVTGGDDLSNQFCSHSTYVKVATNGNSDRVNGEIFVSLYGDKTSSAMKEVTSGKTLLKKDSVYEREIDFTENIGNLEKIKLLWEKDEYEITRPRLRIDNVQIYYGDDQITYKFCNNGQTMDHDVRYTFYPC